MRRVVLWCLALISVADGYLRESGPTKFCTSEDAATYGIDCQVFNINVYLQGPYRGPYDVLHIFRVDQSICPREQVGFCKTFSSIRLHQV